VISFVVYFPETLILGSLNTKALLLETSFAHCDTFFLVHEHAVYYKAIKMVSV